MESVVDPSYELIDPCPDIYALFSDFNRRFFDGRLDGCELKWSTRMTTCAGVCSYEFRSRFCSIRLSQPLLTLRPRKDLVETLLHEMIHAYLFMTVRSKDRDGHGPDFQYHMHRINKEAQTNITIYHTFHREVAVFKQHVWRCNGPCRNRRPYFGIVKRASNRAPSKNDFWFADHQRNCGGTFIKEKEPEGYQDKRRNKGKENVVEGKKDDDRKQPKIDQIFNGKRQRERTPPKVFETGGKTLGGNGGPSRLLSLFDTQHTSNAASSSGTASSGGQQLGGNTNGRSRLLEDEPRESEPPPRFPILLLREELYTRHMTLGEMLTKGQSRSSIPPKAEYVVLSDGTPQHFHDGPSSSKNSSFLPDILPDILPVSPSPPPRFPLLPPSPPLLIDLSDDLVVDCPCCPLRLPVDAINAHLDVCLGAT